MADGESLNGFARRVSDAARTHLIKKMGLTKNFSLFVPDIFPGSVVVDLMKFSGEHGEPRVRKLMSMSFEGKDGGLTFGEPVEVQRRIQYAPIAKSAPSIWDR